MSGNGVTLRHLKLGKDIFTTGQVAKICGVAPRTCSKWCDGGRMKGTYRVPGSNDRRIPRSSLLAFLKENGFPLGELDDVKAVLLVGVGSDMAAAIQAETGVRWLFAEDGFEAGIALSKDYPSVVVIDFALGRSESLAIARRMRESWPHVRLVALTNEDEPDGEQVRAAFDVAARKPVGPGDVLAMLGG